VVRAVWFSQPIVFLIWRPSASLRLMMQKGRYRGLLAHFFFKVSKIHKVVVSTAKNQTPWLADGFAIVLNSLSTNKYSCFLIMRRKIPWPWMCWGFTWTLSEVYKSKFWWWTLPRLTGKPFYVCGLSELTFCGWFVGTRLCLTAYRFFYPAWIGGQTCKSLEFVESSLLLAGSPLKELEICKA
jgi:hypothetical protein